MAQGDEIEDVLASVRRLVSSDGNAAANRPEPVTASRAPILLLGPSCRVTEVEDPFQMIRSLAQEEQDARDARHLLDERMKRSGPELWHESAVPEPRREVGTPGPDGLTDLADRMGGDEALRNLIAETVRQELSGDLGQRITGSVRKLVRHELLRMLTSEPED